MNTLLFLCILGMVSICELLSLQYQVEQIAIIIIMYIQYINNNEIYMYYNSKQF